MIEKFIFMVNALNAPNDNLINAHKPTINDVILFSGNLKTVYKNFKNFFLQQKKLSFDKRPSFAICGFYCYEYGLNIIKGMHQNNCSLRSTDFLNIIILCRYLNLN